MKMLSLALIANCILIRLISIKREEMNFVNFHLPRCCEPFLFFAHTHLQSIDVWKIIIARLTRGILLLPFHAFRR